MSSERIRKRPLRQPTLVDEGTPGYDTRTTYSSTTEVQALISLPDGRTYKLGTIGQITYNKHRDKYPVTALGSRHMKGITKGHRSIQGSLVFKTLDRQVFYKVMANPEEVTSLMMNRREIKQHGSFTDAQKYADQLPPFDVTMVMIDDYGNCSTQTVRGIVLHGQGMVLSIDSLEILQTYQFSARRIEKLVSLTNPRSPGSKNTQSMTTQQTIKSFTSSVNREVR